ncbi:MAG: response regulator [Thermoanaerobaculia bacterium]
MDADLEGLVPVFLEEARERLRRLTELVPVVATEADVAIEAKRELHTLKGAGRMMQLAPFAELCHAAEEAIDAGAPRLGARLTAALDALATMADAVERGEDPGARHDLLAELAGTEHGSAPASPDAPAPEAAAAMPVAGPQGEVRVAAAALDEFAERAARVRSAARSVGRLLSRLHEIAHLAEEGLRDANPAQILAVVATSLRAAATETETSQARLERDGDEQLDAVLALELQPLGPWMRSLARHARELARGLGREIEVELAGEETRLDRRIARELEAAMVHLVGNAVDHGCEPAAQRRAAGKSEVARLRLAARAAGRGVEIEVRDDGRGIDAARVLERAVATGLVSPAAALCATADEALRLLFLPGFSTREEVSQISGRGIGLDAVQSAVARLGGEARLESRPGEGTRVLLEVPAERRGERALLVRAGGERLAIPAAAVRSVRPAKAATIESDEGGDFVRFDARRLPLVALSPSSTGAAAVGAAGPAGEEPWAPAASSESERVLLEASAGGRGFALAVDRVDGVAELLIRPFPAAAGAPRHLEGFALLPSGEPVALVAIAGLASGETELPPPARDATAAARATRVLLVDDSRVTRELERRLLEDAGFAVELADDGDEALRRLEAEPFDVLVTDIEMPRLDGYELAARLRRSERFARLPIVVVSTRDRPEQRLRGLRAGADAYLTKQSLSASDLAETVRRLAGR